MTVLETERMILRWMTAEDAAFMLELLNDPLWIRFIGDRGARTLDDARQYIEKGPAASYARHGFGLYLTELKSSGAPIGICGLIKRDSLEDVDVGFAFLPPYRGQGFAFEAASAVVSHGRSAFGLTRIVAVTDPENQKSIRVLEKLGLRFERMVRLAADDVEISLYACGAPPSA